MKPKTLKAAQVEIERLEDKLSTECGNRRVWQDTADVIRAAYTAQKIRHCEERDAAERKHDAALSRLTQAHQRDKDALQHEATLALDGEARANRRLAELRALVQPVTHWRQRSVFGFLRLSKNDLAVLERIEGVLP